MTHFVYLLECSNGALYTGYTSDIERRYKEHLKGTEKCRYTRSFPPKKLLVFWEFNAKTIALRVEAKIKKLQKAKKEKLITLDISALLKILALN